MTWRYKGDAVAESDEELIVWLWQAWNHYSQGSVRHAEVGLWLDYNMEWWMDSEYRASEVAHMFADGMTIAQMGRTLMERFIRDRTHGALDRLRNGIGRSGLEESEDGDTEARA